MAVKKAGKKKKKPASKKGRLRKDYLPRWPNAFFERWKSASEMRALTGIIISALVAGLVLARGGGPACLPVFIGLYAVIFILWKLGEKTMENRKDMGTFLEEEGTRSILDGGKVCSTNWSVWREAVRGGGLRVRPDGIYVTCGQDRLVFGYEVGDAEMQDHVMECYEKFQSNVPEADTLLTREAIGELDRRFFFLGSVRRKLCVLLVLAFLTPVLALSGESGLMWADIWVVGPLELFLLFMIYRSARAADESTKKVNGMMRLPDPVKMDQRTGYRIFYIAAVLLIVVNFIFILMINAGF